jgi:hypothetical protein
MKRIYKAIEFEIGNDSGGFYILIEGKMRDDRYKTETAAGEAVKAWVDSLERLFAAMPQ